VLVEGGTKTLQFFINAHLWDEARVITNEKMIIENGIDAPAMKGFLNYGSQKYFSDTVDYFKRK
jgi:diaminohydroxyphosphoribosylaminopyrimidine deaminase/5-amino-6-(5-phosphoribosylamino)uracil reductase